MLIVLIVLLLLIVLIVLFPGEGQGSLFVEMVTKIDYLKEKIAITRHVCEVTKFQLTTAIRRCTFCAYHSTVILAQ